ncbi:hypothetical protein CHUAL_000881 [Chamberlinius hualienensis]
MNYCRYLVHNEQLIDKLAESKFMRRAAQWTVYLGLRGKAIGENVLKSQLEDGAYGDRLKSFTKKFTSEVKAGMKNIQDDMKKKNN